MKIPAKQLDRHRAVRGYIQEFGCSIIVLALFTVIVGISLSKHPNAPAPWLCYAMGFGIGAAVVVLFWGIPMVLDRIRSR